jgi:hypothetical protein
MSDSYKNLLSHIEHHNIRQWLMDGARREDARTIMAAIKDLSDGQLQRRFARMLSGEYS